MLNMFSFFDDSQNPFMNMMNGDNQTPNEDTTMPMVSLMQQAFKLQMQFMQSMCMMPLCMMQTMSTVLGALPGDAAPEKTVAEKTVAGHAGGFKIGDMDIPPEILGTLMSMDMSPENLEKLQKLLDFVFELMPQSKKATETEE